MRISIFVGPILGGLVGSFFGLDFAFLVLSGSAMAAGALILPAFSGRTIEEVPTGESIRGLLTSTLQDNRRALLITSTPVIVLMVLREARRVFIPLWGDDLEMDIAAIGLVVGLSSLIDSTFFYPVGVAMDRWGRKWTAVPSLTCLALGLLLLPLTSETYGFVGVALLLGIGNGLSSGMAMTLGADLAPLGRTPPFLGVWRLIGDMGTAEGPLTIGLITGVASLAVASVATGGLGVAGALVMALMVKETLRRSRGPEAAQAREPD